MYSVMCEALTLERLILDASGQCPGSERTTRLRSQVFTRRRFSSSDFLVGILARPMTEIDGS